MAGSTVGIVSLGIQICEGLLSYYNGWKAYESDISGTYDSISDLRKTLNLLKESMHRGDWDEEKSERVKSCLKCCEDGFMSLSKKLRKLRSYEEPEGLWQKAWAELQRACYPFRASTLVRLREIVSDVQERLKLAIQILQLDATTSSQTTLLQVAACMKDTAARTLTMEASIVQIASQNEQILAMQPSKHLKEIEDQISPLNPWADHDSARRPRQQGTGQWLLDSDKYRDWLQIEQGTLLCTRILGAGKKILTSLVVDDLTSRFGVSLDIGLAHIYCNFGTKTNRKLRHCLQAC